jgi:hypothetical protein
MRTVEVILKVKAILKMDDDQSVHSWIEDTETQLMGTEGCDVEDWAILDYEVTDSH